MKKIVLLMTYSLLMHCLLAQNPIAVNDTLTLIENTKLLGEVILNDILQNDSISTTLLTEEDGGIEVTDGVLNPFCANGTFCYNPNPDFVGIDTFTYILTDSIGSMDTAMVFLNVIPRGSVARGTNNLICTSTIWPSCRAAFFDNPDPCGIPLTSTVIELVSENTSNMKDNTSAQKSLLSANDSCDFFAIYDPPQFGNLYLTNANSSNITDTSNINGIVNGLFYYEPIIVGLLADTFGILKCGVLEADSIYCDSIEVAMTIFYEEPCDYTTIDKYCCISTTSTFPCDVLANDSAIINSIFPAPDYMVSGVDISNILMPPDSGMVNINGTADSLLYDAGGFAGIDSLTYQTQFTVTDSLTGQTITFLSSPQPVFIITDDDCTVEVETNTQLVTVGGTLCIPPSDFLNVESEFFVFCPDGVVCTNDLLSDYIYGLPPDGYIDNSGKINIPIPEDCPPSVTIRVCETEYPDDCIDVVIPLIYEEKIPTLSEWSLIILSLLILIIGTVAIKTEQQTTLKLSSSS